MYMVTLLELICSPLRKDLNALDIDLLICFRGSSERFSGWCLVWLMVCAFHLKWEGSTQNLNMPIFFVSKLIKKSIPQGYSNYSYPKGYGNHLTHIPVLTPNSGWLNHQLRFPA